MYLLRLAGLLVVAVTALLSGCATTINARHDPLYRATPHTTTITANARDTASGISQITIDVTIGEITACTELGGFIPSVVPCRRNAENFVQGCVFVGGPQNGSCTFTRSLPDRALVTYRTSITSVAGATASTRPITYAGGASLTQAEVNFGPLHFTMPWEVARPVWWNTDNPSGFGTPSDTIDVGFFPAADYNNNYAGFTNDMGTILLAAHFNTGSQTFAQNYTLWKGLFNLWAGPPGANASGCTRSFGGLASNVASVTDGEAIVHSGDFRDCSAIALGGSGSVQGTLGDAAWVYTHESGHFLQGLGDEYCCDGGYAFVSNPGNVFGSQSACQTTASAIGIATSNCVEIASGTTHTGKWRIDVGQLETMRDRDLGSDWRGASGRAVGNRVNACINGSCY